MRLVLCESVAETGQVAAEIFASRIEQGPCVLGLATGSSPLPVYQYLIRRYRESGLSFAQCTAFTLDEYVGLQPYDSRSYRATIRDEFVDHVDLPTRSLHSPTPPTRIPERYATPRPPTRKRSAWPVGSTFSCWGSVPTGTSASTSRPRRWPRAPASKR